MKEWTKRILHFTFPIHRKAKIQFHICPSFYELDFDTQDITILKDGVEVGFDSIEANNVLTVTETPSQNDSSVIEDIKIVEFLRKL